MRRRWERDEEEMRKRFTRHRTIRWAGLGWIDQLLNDNWRCCWFGLLVSPNSKSRQSRLLKAAFCRIRHWNKRKSFRKAKEDEGQVSSCLCISKHAVCKHSVDRPVERASSISVGAFSKGEWRCVGLPKQDSRKRRSGCKDGRQNQVASEWKGPTESEKRKTS